MQTYQNNLPLRKPFRARNRAKTFGEGRRTPLDREAKHRLLRKAEDLAKRRKSAARPHCHRPITPCALGVFKALLLHFHNGKTGACYPSYEAIAAIAGCDRSTVAEAIKELEACGLLSWMRRIERVRVDGVITVRRTSNAYFFTVELSPVAKSDNPTGTIPTALPFLSKRPSDRAIQAIALQPEEPMMIGSSLMVALKRLGSLVKGGLGGQQ
jgi:hypothetical protein